MGTSLHERATKYDPGYGTSRGWIAFSVPARFESTSPRIELEDAAWRLPERVADVLSKPLSEWELVSASTPTELAAREPFEVSLEVRNTGDITGRFRGVLNTAGIGPAYAPHPFVIDVEPDETGAWNYRDSAPRLGPERGISPPDTSGGPGRPGVGGRDHADGDPDGRVTTHEGVPTHHR